ncbi:adaptor protein MecA [Lacrimispora sp. NSJ-141]|uniref:Adaptor protein MecA n=1 Tax=Lientehia hominis TaxID=2897778 RepID=A0AAP2RLG3_9FIRM|nr:adaptor protein MecA [Lientehia hominis]MCD2493178.1 adaptor protein MecA [Lientehia hominis]
MKIEKISDNQIRCTLDSSDLTDRQLNLGELAYGSDKARRLFREMMQQAFNDFGFEAEDNPLMVEAIPLSGDSIMLIITKVDDPEELDTRFAKFAPSSAEDETDYDDNLSEPGLEGALKLDSAEEDTSSPAPEPADKTRVFRFSTLESVSLASHVLGDSFDGYNSLYRNPSSRDYLLVISQQGYAEETFVRVLNTLSEFGTRKKNTYATEAYFQEHYDIIIKGTALQILQTL